MPDYPIIHTKRLLLMMPPVEAAPQLLRYFEENRAHLSRWSPPIPADYYAVAYWHERLHRARREFEQDGSMQLVLLERESDPHRVVGVCNFTAFLRGAFQACYLGYSLDYREEGRGLMFEALAAAIRYVFNELRLHRIMANYIPSNERSGRLLRRLGFTVEGYARDYLFINGEWRDHILTSLTNTHWQPGEMR